MYGSRDKDDEALTYLKISVEQESEKVQNYIKMDTLISIITIGILFFLNLQSTKGGPPLWKLIKDNSKEATLSDKLVRSAKIIRIEKDTLPECNLYSENTKRTQHSYAQDIANFFGLLSKQRKTTVPLYPVKRTAEGTSFSDKCNHDERLFSDKNFDVMSLPIKTRNNDDADSLNVNYVLQHCRIAWKLCLSCRRDDFGINKDCDTVCYPDHYICDVPALIKKKGIVP